LTTWEPTETKRAIACGVTEISAVVAAYEDEDDDAVVADDAV
jgi:hypothetical protein